MTDRASMTTAEIKAWAAELPDDAIVLAQVTGTEDTGAWSMHYKLSDELTHFKWPGPVYCITLFHPDLASVNPNVKWKEE